MLVKGFLYRGVPFFFFLNAFNLDVLELFEEIESHRLAFRITVVLLPESLGREFLDLLHMFFVGLVGEELS